MRATSPLWLVACTLEGLTTSTMGVEPTRAITVKSPGMSNGSDFSTLGKMTTLFDTTASVLPSGAERARVCKPMTPPAPVWFSTTTGAPNALANAGCAARVIASTPEPAAFGRTKRTGVCAAAPAANRKSRRDQRIFIPGILTGELVQGGEQLLGIDRLAHHDVGADLAGDAKVVALRAHAAARDRHDLEAGPAAAERDDGLQAVDAGHEDVGDQQIGRLLVLQLERLVRVGGAHGVVAAALEEQPHRLPHVLIVVQHQDAHCSWRKFAKRPALGLSGATRRIRRSGLPPRAS